MIIFNFRTQKGFTLVELIVAITITAILGTLGIAGFVNYNQAQVLQTSVNEVITMLNFAKSRAQSQIKPSNLCFDEKILGYTVAISELSRYTLYLRCETSGDIKIDEEDKSLPAGLSFGANTSFFFPVQTGGVENSGDVRITSDGKTKTIRINALGGIAVE